MKNSMVKIGKVLPVGLEIIKEALNLVQTVARLDLEKKQMDRQFQLSVHEIDRRSEIIHAALDLKEKEFARNAELIKCTLGKCNELIQEMNQLVKMTLDLTSDENLRFKLIKQMSKFSMQALRENGENLRAFLASDCNKTFQIDGNSNEN